MLLVQSQCEHLIIPAHYGSDELISTHLYKSRIGSVLAFVQKTETVQNANFPVRIAVDIQFLEMGFSQRLSGLKEVSILLVGITMRTEKYKLKKFWV
jgi:hypothetical protein